MIEWFKVNIPEALPGEPGKEMIIIFMQGLKRTVADLKQRGIMSIWERKQPISKDGYRQVAQLILKIQPDHRSGKWTQMTFAWAFLLLSWNLVETYTTCNMSWQGNCLQIRYGAHKSDQEGSTSNYGMKVQLIQRFARY